MVHLCVCLCVCVTCCIIIIICIIPYCGSTNIYIYIYIYIFYIFITFHLVGQFILCILVLDTDKMCKMLCDRNAEKLPANRGSELHPVRSYHTLISNTVIDIHYIS